MPCNDCPLYQPFKLLLECIDSERGLTFKEKFNKIKESMPVCNCKKEEPKAKDHHKYCDTVYFWKCPIHGKMTEKSIMEMTK